ncbi:MAG: bifunctional metallophosphatase/5'-nucleotidase [Betaproteobacteria bacterium]|nr:bifunctional metallophosphatase/5'-nucleotidase [Betaproteobacteria bacterium]
MRSDHAFAIVRIFAAILATLLAGCAPQLTRTEPVSLRLIALNDFHGNLKTPGALRLPDPKEPGKQQLVVAGGAAHLATAIASLRKDTPNSIVVGAGDLISASPLISSLFNDEPTIEVLDRLGVDISSVGNHEFDRGKTELLRLVNGGCLAEGCITGSPYSGARFRYLAANVIETATGRSVLPAYEIRKVEGVPVAFIGMTLKSTPAVVTRSGVAGLRFDDEVETVNTLVPKLRAEGVEAIVVLIHEGGFVKGAWDDPACPGFNGEIVEITRRFDKAVDLVVSGHTHRAYACKVDGRWVTSAGDYGRFLTRIDLKLSPLTRDVVSIEAKNILIDIREYSPDPAVAALIDKYDKLAAPRANRIVGYLKGELLPVANDAGESALGNFIADAQLAATRVAGAEVAFMNPGGVRAALSPKQPDGGITYSDIFSAQPFGNTLVTMSLSGEQILRILENQFPREADGFRRVLSVSDGFTYVWDNARPHGSKVVFESVRLSGQPLDRAKRYRVTVNSFMADGGDGITLLREGTDREGGMLDLDALENWLRAKGSRESPFATAPLTRIKRLN